MNKVRFAALFLVLLAVGLPLGAQNKSDAGAGVPDKAVREYNKGNELAEKESFDKALERYNKAINIHPQYADALNAAGTVYLKQGDPAKASEFFKRAIAADPNHVPTHLQMVRAAAATGDKATADQHLGKAASLAPDNPQVLATTFQLRMMQGRYDDAIAAVRKLHSVSHKDYADLHLAAAGILEAQGKKAEAATEYRAFLSERPDGEDATRAKDALARLEPPRQ